jgi:hypothetical protein
MAVVKNSLRYHLCFRNLTCNSLDKSVDEDFNQSGDFY